MCRRRLLLSAATAALLLAPAALATPLPSLASPETTKTTVATLVTAPTPHAVRLQSQKPDRPLPVDSSAPSTQTANCDGVRCLWNHWSEQVRVAAARLGGDVEELTDFIAYSPDETLPIPKDDQDDSADELDAQGTRSDEYEAQFGTIHVGDNSYPYYPGQPPLLMTVALLAIAVCYFSLRGINHLQRRTARLCLQHEPLPTVSDPHRCRRIDIRYSRRAGRRIQQEAITRCLCNVLGRWVRGNESSESKRPDGIKPLNPSEAEASTMEGELARLREAADFIDNVVAAGRGTSRSVAAASEPFAADCQGHSLLPQETLTDCDGHSSRRLADGDHPLVVDGLQHARNSSNTSPDGVEEDRGVGRDGRDKA